MSLTGLIFATAFFSGLALALFRHPLFGLYTYVAVFYLHPPSRWWGNELPDLRWALLAAAVTLIATLFHPTDESRPSWISTTPAKLLIAFVAWIWVQNLWALDPVLHMELSILYTKYILLYYLIFRLVDTTEKITAFLLMNVIGCAYLGWIAFNAAFSGRLAGVGGPGIDEANALALQMATGALIGSMLILVFRDWRRWLCIAVMPFILNTIVLTGSRSAFLGLAAGAITLFFLKPQSHRKLFYVFSVVGLILAGMLAHETFVSRMATIGTAAEQPQTADQSIQIRFALMGAQLNMAQEYPQGTGHRGTTVLSPFYLDDKHLTGGTRGGVAARSSHNTLLTVLVEQGMPGVLLFGGLILWFARTAMYFRRLARDASLSQLSAQAAGITAAFVGVLISGIFVDYLKIEVQIWCFGLAASIAAIAKSRQCSSAADVPSAIPRRSRAIP